MSVDPARDFPVIAEENRTVLALVRAQHDGRHRDWAAILERPVRPDTSRDDALLRAAVELLAEVATDEWIKDHLEGIALLEAQGWTS